jgi:hypothetical protein
LRGTGEQELVTIATTFTSNKSGEFTFNAPDFAMLFAEHPDHGEGYAPVDQDVQVTHTLTIELNRERRDRTQAVIRGLVVGEDARPLQDVTVSAGSARKQSATTDANGHFDLEVPRAGNHHVSLRREGYAELNTPIQANVPRVTVAMSKSGRVRGRVVRAEGGAVVPSFQVAVFAKRDGMQQPLLATATIFDAEGEFEVAGIAAGPVEIVASAYGLARSAPVAAEATQEPSAITITLPAGGSLTGTVVDGETKSPLASAKVSSEDNLGTGPGAQPSVAVAITDKSGKFTLRGLPLGRRSVVVAAHAHHTRIISGLQVRSGEELGPMTIELSPAKPGEEHKLELAGIGAAVSGDDDGLKLLKVLEGGGAFDAELAEGDRIVKVDGTSVLELGFGDAIQALRGPVDTVVRLDIIRGQNALGEIPVTRKKIRF